MNFIDNDSDDTNSKFEKVISIIDSQFRIELQADGIGILLKRLFCAFDTNTITTFSGSLPDDRIDILLTDLEKPNAKGSH